MTLQAGSRLATCELLATELGRGLEDGNNAFESRVTTESRETPPSRRSKCQGSPCRAAPSFLAYTSGEVLKAHVSPGELPERQPQYQRSRLRRWGLASGLSVSLFVFSKPTQMKCHPHGDKREPFKWLVACCFPSEKPSLSKEACWCLQLFFQRGAIQISPFLKLRTRNVFLLAHHGANSHPHPPKRFRSNPLKPVMGTLPHGKESPNPLKKAFPIPRGNDGPFSGLALRPCRHDFGKGK